MAPGEAPPAGGYGPVGKAAGIFFLALRHRPVTGCVEPGEDGLQFVDEEKNNGTDALITGDVYLKTGQRVELAGQKSKSGSGAQTFTATKLVKSLRACGETKPAGRAKPPAAAPGSSC